ncbi:Protein required for attachment to host cells [Paracoccus solventivorans]|uniref:Host attachment protein n=1 Tax=Paracoccus solventivorans TaxID=53463 RepID=A0A1M7J5F7_9RHOB|nr:host attachment family protein [Paracoccus solventivorans]SHM48141.1 Protein required for attachment to host cells [Paracoccus solventivorans]HHW34474.1 host attachment protein [Paracoccus solventivorans]
MLSHNALVVVADGHQAVLLRNIAKYGIELQEQERIGPAHLQDESQGRQPEETTPRDEDEATFAKQLTERLNRMVLQNKVDELAVIADPSTLGVMRKNYHKMLEQKLVKELPKTLTSASAEEIARALA